MGAMDTCVQSTTGHLAEGRESCTSKTSEEWEHIQSVLYMIVQWNLSFRGPSKMFIIKRNFTITVASCTSVIMSQSGSY